MTEYEREAVIQNSAAEMFSDLHQYRVVRYYITPSCNRFMWHVGLCKAVNLNDNKAIGKLLVTIGFMDSKIKNRVKIVDEFTSICRQYVEDIRHAPDQVKRVAREQKLYN